MSDDQNKTGGDSGVSPGASGRVKQVHAPVKDDAAEKSDLHDPGVTTPEDHDEKSFSGSNPSLTSDDDIDEVGKEYGVGYGDDEELNMADKVKMQTESEPPEK